MYNNSKLKFVSLLFRRVVASSVLNFLADWFAWIILWCNTHFGLRVVNQLPSFTKTWTLMLNFLAIWAHIVIRTVVRVRQHIHVRQAYDVTGCTDSGSNAENPDPGNIDIRCCWNILRPPGACVRDLVASFTISCVQSCERVVFSVKACNYVDKY